MTPRPADVPVQNIVFGATGIVGGYIVEHLLRESQRPLALSRARHHDSRIDWVQGDLAAAQALTLPPIGTIYCTTAAWLLADALHHIRQPSIRRVVAFTSTSIVTKIDSAIPQERAFLRQLADAEQRLIATCEQYEIAWTILRPTLIYAEGRDNNVTRLARMIRTARVLPLLGDGRGLRQPVRAEDLAVGAIAAARSDAAIGKIYDVPGGEALSYREMAGRIFDALGQQRRIIAVPAPLWRLAFAMAQPWFPGVNAAMGDRMAMDMVFDGGPAARDFGWSPRGFHPRFEDGF